MHYRSPGRFATNLFGPRLIEIGDCGSHHEDDKPVSLETVLVSTQHDDGIDRDETIRPELVEQVIKPVIPAEFVGDDYNVFVNPTGRFVIGGPVSGGMYGEYPSLKPEDQLEGDLHFNNDFRSTYATLLERWLGVEPAPIVNGHFEQFDFIAP